MIGVFTGLGLVNPVADALSRLHRDAEEQPHDALVAALQQLCATEPAAQLLAEQEAESNLQAREIWLSIRGTSGGSRERGRLGAAVPNQVSGHEPNQRGARSKADSASRLARHADVNPIKASRQGDGER